MTTLSRSALVAGHFHGGVGEQVLPARSPRRWPVGLGPRSGNGWFRGTVLPGQRRPFFFDRRQAAGLQGGLLGEVDEIVGQLAEALVALDPLADRLDLIGRNALAEVFAAEPPLQDVVGTLANGFAAASGLEELLPKLASVKETV